MSGIRVVREYDTITCNREYENNSGFRYLGEKHFRELEQFIREYSADEGDSDALEFMKIGYRRNVGDTISFNSNVGIIELPSGYQIEVLPKVSLAAEDPDNSLTKRIFLDMLCCLQDFEGKSFGDAALNADRMNLYEIFINMYLQEALGLVKRGIKSSYISQEDNLRYYKGKLLVSDHIKLNAAHKERFFMQYDEYLVNRPENRLVKATLCKLQKISGNYENVKLARQLLSAFEMVEEAVNYEADFAKITLGRDTKEYSLLLQWAKIFLFEKSFTTFSGENAGKALLFPMEEVFEAFVAQHVKSVFEAESHGDLAVTGQDHGHYLFDEPRRFQLIPDIVVRGAVNGDKRTIILDTKWKRLKPNVTNYGISRDDMYQMYAYAKKYGTSEIWLLYPLHEEVKDLRPVSFHAVNHEQQRVDVNVFFVDLEHYRESIRELYERVNAPCGLVV